MVKTQNEREKELARMVGKAIAARRKEVGMTQDGLGEKLNVGIEAVSRMERGAIMPSIPRLVEVAAALNCPVQELLLVGSDRSIDRAVQLATKLEKLSVHDQEVVMEIVDRLVQRLRG